MDNVNGDNILKNENDDGISREECDVKNEGIINDESFSKNTNEDDISCDEVSESLVKGDSLKSDSSELISSPNNDKDININGESDIMTNDVTDSIPIDSSQSIDKETEQQDVSVNNVKDGCVVSRKISEQCNQSSQQSKLDTDNNVDECAVLDGANNYEENITNIEGDAKINDTTSEKSDLNEQNQTSVNGKSDENLIEDIGNEGDIKPSEKEDKTSVKDDDDNLVVDTPIDNTPTESNDRKADPDSNEMDCSVSADAQGKNRLESVIRQLGSVLDVKPEEVAMDSDDKVSLDSDVEEDVLLSSSEKEDTSNIINLDKQVC